LWMLLSRFFPRMTPEGTLRLSRLDELLLTILSAEWQTPVAIFCHKSQSGVELRQIARRWAAPAHGRHRGVLAGSSVGGARQRPACSIVRSRHVAARPTRTALLLRPAARSRPIR